MKYAITGHTKNIGLCLFNRLSPNVMGFSKSNGFDIQNQHHRTAILEQSKNCDVFINNACAGFGQTQLLISLAELWSNEPSKHIINVGSKITEVILSKEQWRLAEYQAYKISLKIMIEKLQPLVQCKLSYKFFGYVATKEIQAKYPHFTDRELISIDRAADIILS